MLVLGPADYGVRYVVHVIRIGEAITLSLKGSVSAIDDFQEKRRWLYQSKNPDWHLASWDLCSHCELSILKKRYGSRWFNDFPHCIGCIGSTSWEPLCYQNLSCFPILFSFVLIPRYVPALPSNISVEVQFLPVCFAPFLPASKGLQAAHLVHFADSCEQHCQEGEDSQMSFGTNCSREEVVTFQTKQQKAKRKDGKGPNVENTSMCLFVAEPKRQLNATKEGSLSGTGTTLVTWLRDTLLSSKAAELRFAGHGPAAELQTWTLQLVEDPKEAEAKDGHVSNRFSTTVPAQTLLMRNMQLLVATTQDETDAEEQAVLLRIVPHPPPILLSQNVTEGFFVSRFWHSSAKKQLCCLQDWQSIPCGRSFAWHSFQSCINSRDIGEKLLGWCEGTKAFQRSPSRSSCTYCQSYQPWNEDYDVAATFSYEQCLYDAIDLGDNNKLQQIAKTIADYRSDETSSCYDVIPRAIHVGRTNTTMLKTLLQNKFDPSCVVRRCHYKQLLLAALCQRWRCCWARAGILSQLDIFNFCFFTCSTSHILSTVHPVQSGR